MRPIVLYLDSADYSKLSEPNAESSGPLGSIKSFLQDAVEGGTLLVPYSAVHLMEACHLEPQYKSLALRRVELMERLSAGRAFRHFTDMIASEARVVLGKEDRVCSVVSENGAWYPADSRFGVDLKAEIAKTLDETIRDQIASAPNRRGRKLIEKVYGTPGHLKASALRALARDKALMSRIAIEYGVSPTFITECLGEDWLLPSYSVERLQSEVFTEIFRPRNLVGDYLDRFSRDPTWLPNVVRNLGHQLIDSVARFRSSIGSLGLREEGVGAVRKLKREAGTSLPYVVDLRLALVKASVSETDLSDSDKARLECVELGKLPGTDSMAAAFSYLIQETLFGSLEKRSLKASDAGDGVHMFYLPYVDLWRGDGFSSHTVGVVNGNNAGRVVSKLIDLPKRISDLQCRVS